MNREFAVVDLFAGPGGLAEGFASVRTRDGTRPFRIVLSVEKEPAAFETLRLRSFLRQFSGSLPKEYYHFLNGEIEEPEWSNLYPEQWKRACHETLKLELGSEEAGPLLEARFSQIVKRYKKNVILIGGPPCQAYSLVGRARNKGIKNYNASEDHRHFLYKEYIRILRRLMPAIFVMENVKGMLSSSVDGERVFERVLDDLSEVGSGAYRLAPLSRARSFSLSDLFGHNRKKNSYPGIGRCFRPRACQGRITEARCNCPQRNDDHRQSQAFRRQVQPLSFVSGLRCAR